jgi:8-oxo-dGTP pyrophosphatase MutT (NUDIX family)
MCRVVIRRIRTLDFSVQNWSWPFALTRHAEIDLHFAQKQQAKPEIWNGRVLLARNAVFAGDSLTASYFETDFASLLAWRDWDFPDKNVFNGFGMGALLSRDGAFALGEMGQHTANAGRIYFPSGTPDPSDVKSGALDIAGSVTRELEEETGLTPAEYQSDQDWHCVFTGSALAMIRILRVDLPGEELRSKIEANLAQQHHPELAGIRLVRTRSDFTAAMPDFVIAFLESQLFE